MFFCYWWLNNIVVVSGTVNLISLWHSLMYRDLYDIWLLGSYWLTRVVREDFVTLIVGSQKPSGESVNIQVSLPCIAKLLPQKSI